MSSEYEGTSPVLRRCRGTKIELRKLDLNGKGKSMAEITGRLIVRVGVDLSNRVYQVHAVERGGRVVLARAMAPQRFFEWCAQLPAGCLVAMEACGGAHHVVRRRGHRARPNSADAGDGCIEPEVRARRGEDRQHLCDRRQ
jgi:hypothetical protein